MKDKIIKILSVIGLTVFMVYSQITSVNAALQSYLVYDGTGITSFQADFIKVPGCAMNNRLSNTDLQTAWTKILSIVPSGKTVYFYYYMIVKGTWANPYRIFLIPNYKVGFNDKNMIRVETVTNYWTDPSGNGKYLPKIEHWDLSVQVTDGVIVYNAPSMSGTWVKNTGTGIISYTTKADGTAMCIDSTNVPFVSLYSDIGYPIPGAPTNLSRWDVWGPEFYNAMQLRIIPPSITGTGGAQAGTYNEYLYPPEDQKDSPCSAQSFSGKPTRSYCAPKSQVTHNVVQYMPTGGLGKEINGTDGPWGEGPGGGVQPGSPPKPPTAQETCELTCNGWCDMNGVCFKQPENEEDWGIFEPIRLFLVFLGDLLKAIFNIAYLAVGALVMFIMALGYLGVKLADMFNANNGLVVKMNSFSNNVTKLIAYMPSPYRDLVSISVTIIVVFLVLKLVGNIRRLI